MSIVPIIAIIEERYRDFLFVCKHLGIDPSREYDLEFIAQKVDDALALEGNDKKTIKKLSWFKKNYKKMEGGVFGNKYISRAKKEIAKGKLVLDYDIAD